MGITQELQCLNSGFHTGTFENNSHRITLIHGLSCRARSSTTRLLLGVKGIAQSLEGCCSRGLCGQRYGRSQKAILLAKTYMLEKEGHLASLILLLFALGC